MLRIGCRVRSRPDRQSETAGDSSGAHLDDPGQTMRPSSFTWLDFRRFYVNRDLVLGSGGRVRGRVFLTLGAQSVAVGSENRCFRCVIPPCYAWVERARPAQIEISQGDQHVFMPGDLPGEFASTLASGSGAFVETIPEGTSSYSPQRIVTSQASPDGVFHGDKKLSVEGPRDTGADCQE